MYSAMIFLVIVGANQISGLMVILDVYIRSNAPFSWSTIKNSKNLFFNKKTMVWQYESFLQFKDFSSDQLQMAATEYALNNFADTAKCHLDASQ